MSDRIQCTTCQRDIPHMTNCPHCHPTSELAPSAGLALSAVYRESVKQYRAESDKRVKQCQRHYRMLGNKSTTYARAIAELLAIHGRVAELWRNVPDELAPNGDLSHADTAHKQKENSNGK